jgi:uncharacterized membrane protein
MRKKINYQRRNAKPSGISLSMPSPAILESYEEILPGFSKKLLQLIQSEQEMQRKQDTQLIQNRRLACRFAQVSALVFSMSLLTLCYLISSNFITLMLVGSWLAFLLIINLYNKN